MINFQALPMLLLQLGQFCCAENHMMTQLRFNPQTRPNTGIEGETNLNITGPKNQGLCGSIPN